MNRIKELMFELKLSYAKEMTVISIIDLVIIGLGIFVYFYFKNPLYLIYVIGLMLGVNIYYFSRYSSMKRQIEMDQELEFVTVFVYFEMFIKNGFIVYKALEETSKFCSKELKEKFEKLLFEIDTDKTVTPFITFSSQFKSKLIEQVMVSVYQMVDEGNELDDLDQFTMIFSKLDEEKSKDIIEKRKRKADSLNTFPLIGSAFIIFIIFFGIISIVGDLLNGI